MSSGTPPPADTRSWFQRLGDEYLVIQRQNMGRMGRLTPDTVGITLPPESQPTVDAAKLADDLTPDRRAPDKHQYRYRPGTTGTTRCDPSGPTRRSGRLIPAACRRRTDRRRARDRRLGLPPGESAPDVNGRYERS